MRLPLGPYSQPRFRRTRSNLVNAAQVNPGPIGNFTVAKQGTFTPAKPTTVTPPKPVTVTPPKPVTVTPLKSVTITAKKPGSRRRTPGKFPTIQFQGDH